MSETRAQKHLRERTQEFIKQHTEHVTFNDLSEFYTNEEEQAALMSKFDQVVAKSTRQPVKGKTIQPLTEECRIAQAFLKDGYPYIYVGKKQLRLNRFTVCVMLGIKELPHWDDNNEKVEVRHLCNEPTCFEPTHLELGTSSKNSDDQQLSETMRKGETSNLAKLTEENVKELRRLKDTMTVQQRAEKFGVTPTNVWQIDIGQTWTHVPLDDGSFVAKDNSKLEKIKEATKRARAGDWTPEMWKAAEDKLDDPKYVQPSTKNFYEGTPCMEWQLGLTKKGYPKVNINGAVVPGHKLVCMISLRGPLPKGALARHLCNNRKCVLHVVVGTYKENSKDRSLNEGKDGSRKLSNVQVVEMIKLFYEEKMSRAQLALKYNVSSATVSNIVNGTRRIIAHTPEVQKYFKSEKIENDMTELPKKEKRQKRTSTKVEPDKLATAASPPKRRKTDLESE